MSRQSIYFNKQMDVVVNLCAEVNREGAIYTTNLYNSVFYSLQQIHLQHLLSKNETDYGNVKRFNRRIIKDRTFAIFNGHFYLHGGPQFYDKQWAEEELECHPDNLYASEIIAKLKEDDVKIDYYNAAMRTRYNIYNEQVSRPLKIKW